eukprot:757767-Hanusia_phi.AAC.4
MKRVEEDAALWVGDEGDAEAQSLKAWIDALGETLEKTEDPLLRGTEQANPSSESIQHERVDFEDAEDDDDVDVQEQLASSRRRPAHRDGRRRRLRGLVQGVLSSARQDRSPAGRCSCCKTLLTATAGAICLSAYLHYLGHLEALKLSGNNIHEEGMISLARFERLLLAPPLHRRVCRCFGACGKLKAIFLDNNRIGMGGARALGDASAEMASALEVLSVSSNKLTDPACNEYEVLRLRGHSCASIVPRQAAHSLHMPQVALHRHELHRRHVL